MENNEKLEAAQRELVLHYMKTLVDVARESILILDFNFKVLSANPIFYETFQVSPKETENRFIFELGDHQWDIPKLKELLSKILPDKKIMKDFEVNHKFQTIGERTMLLNARQIDSVQLIIVAIEDITERKKLEEKLACYADDLKTALFDKTEDLTSRLKQLGSMNKVMVGRETKMVELKKEIEKLRELLGKCQNKCQSIHGGEEWCSKNCTNGKK